MWSGNGAGPGCYHGRDLLVLALCFKCNKIWLRIVSWTLTEKTQCHFGKGLALTFLHRNKRDFWQIHQSVLKGLLTVHWRFRGKWSPSEQKSRGVCVCVFRTFFFWDRSQGTRRLRALLVKSPWEDMMLLARYAQDKTRGAAALDYCQGLSWNLPLLFGLQRLCRNWGRCCLLPKLCLDGSCPHLGREEGAGGLRGYEVNRKITHLNDAFHWHCHFESLSDLILSVFPSIASHRCD